MPCSVLAENVHSEPKLFSHWAAQMTFIELKFKPLYFMYCIVSNNQVSTSINYFKIRYVFNKSNEFSSDCDTVDCFPHWHAIRTIAAKDRARYSLFCFALFVNKTTCCVFNLQVLDSLDARVPLGCAVKSRNLIKFLKTVKIEPNLEQSNQLSHCLYLRWRPFDFVFFSKPQLSSLLLKWYRKWAKFDRSITFWLGRTFDTFTESTTVPCKIDERAKQVKMCWCYLALNVSKRSTSDKIKSFHINVTLFWRCKRPFKMWNSFENWEANHLVSKKNAIVLKIFGIVE